MKIIIVYIIYNMFFKFNYFIKYIKIWYLEWRWLIY